jgi:hypothetical protein
MRDTEYRTTESGYWPWDRLQWLIFPWDQQENMTDDLLQFNNWIAESLPNCRVTPREITETNKDILVFDTIKEEDVTTSVLSETSEKNTARRSQWWRSGTKLEQRWSHKTCCKQYRSLDTLRKPECSVTNNNNKCYNISVTQKSVLMGTYLYTEKKIFNDHQLSLSGERGLCKRKVLTECKTDYVNTSVISEMPHISWD